jgi:hypothetical protein
VRRILLILTVALVMAVVAVVVAMPAFAQGKGPANPCETGDTPSSPPDVGGSPTTPPPSTPPGYATRVDKELPPKSATPFTGPTDRGSCAH